MDNMKRGPGRPKKYIGEDTTPVSFSLTFSALENLENFARQHNWSRNFALNLILKYLDRPQELINFLTIAGEGNGKTEKIL